MSAPGGRGPRSGAWRRVHEVEDAVEPGDLEHPLDLVAPAHEARGDAGLAEPLVGADQRAQPGRVDEGDAGEVEEDVAVDRVGRDLVELGLEHERAGHVELALEAHHGVVAVAFGTCAEGMESHPDPPFPHARKTMRPPPTVSRTGTSTRSSAG